MTKGISRQRDKCRDPDSIVIAAQGSVCPTIWLGRQAKDLAHSCLKGLAKEVTSGLSMTGNDTQLVSSQ